MIGANLAVLVNTVNNVQISVWRFTFPSLKIISGCSGATKLANVYLFNLLSDYDVTTGVGCNFRKLIAAPLVRDSDKGLALVMLTDDLESLKQRVIALQARSGQQTPDNELLKEAQLLGIDITTEGVAISMKLISKAGTTAFVEV